MEIGDLVKIGEIVGTVEDVTLRSTLIRKFTGELCMIPNGEVRIVTNMSRGWARTKVDLNVDMGEDLDRVIGLVSEVVEALAEDDARGLAYLVADQGGASTDAYVTMDDSYKFAVGDHLQAQDSDYATQTDCGAISAIDRTTYLHMAKITVANTIGVLQTSKGASISIQTKTASPYVEAKGILKAAVDTGTGENAKGGQGVLILKNAMLYVNSLYCYNADALTDLSGASEDGKYLIM